MVFHQSCGSMGSAGGLVPAQFARLEVFCRVVTLFSTDVVVGDLVLQALHPVNSIMVATAKIVAPTAQRVAAVMIVSPNRVIGPCGAIYRLSPPNTRKSQSMSPSLSLAKRTAGSPDF